jgi:Uma2 family endonuclease
VTGADGSFKLGAKRARLPDVGFIASARFPKLPKKFNFAPDLAVEVVSEHEDIFKKALEYLHAGTKVVWAVYTEDKVIHVIRLDEDGGLHSQPFGIDDVLEGGDLLPEFKLPGRDIFPD